KLEVDEQRELQLRNRQITDHLRSVIVVEAFDDFRVDNDLVFNDQVRLKLTYLLPAICDKVPMLLICLQAEAIQLDYQRIFVNRFIHSWAERVQHGHAAPIICSLNSR